MEKFKFCKFLLKLLKLWTSDNNSTLLIIRYLFTLTCHFLNLIALFVSVTQNLNDMEVATENGFACFAFAKSIFIYFWLIIKRSQIKSSIIKLETTIALRIDGGNNADGTPEILYLQAEQKYTKLGQRYTFAWMSIVVFYVVTLLIVPVYDIWHGNTDATNWATIFNATFPIDPSTFLSFAAHYTVDCISVCIHFMICSTTATLYTAMAMYVSAMILDIKSILDKLNDQFKERNYQIMVNESMIKAIRIHGSALKFSRSMAAIMSGILFVVIINSIVFMAIGLFQMETKTQAGAYALYVSSMSVMLESAFIWFFCYHSSLVSMRMAQVAYDAYSTQWYNYTILSKKCILLMIQRSNVRFVFSAFGIFECDLKTLEKVVKSVVSYYLILKKV